MRRRPFFDSIAGCGLFSFALRLELLNLLALILDFLLLRLHLRLGLRVGILRILQRIADYVASTAAQHTADRCTRQRMANGRSDKGATNRADTRAAQRAFFTSRERIS